MSKFEIKERFDKIIYRIFNVLSDAFFFFDKKKKKIIKSNSKFKNIYDGNRCFIIGTGPSINYLSESIISKIEGEVVFGVNSFYKSEKLKNIIPKYYSLLDNNYWGVSSHAFKEISDLYSGKCPTFITDCRAFPVVDPVVSSQDNIYVYSKHYPLSDIRCDLSRNLSISMNVVSTSIQAAIYMGFKEIYLLGCDYNLFCSKGASHCYDDEEELSDLPKYNLAFYLKYYHLTTEIHYMIRRAAKLQGVAIVNLTEESLLDAYPKRSINSVL